MSSYGSERGVLENFDAQIKYIDIDNLVLTQAYWIRKSTSDKHNLVSPQDDHRRASSS